MTQRLEQLHAGQLIPFGGDRVAVVDEALASAFTPGDRLVVVHETGDLLRIPAAEHAIVGDAVTAATGAFADLAGCTDQQISMFYDRFAALLADPAAITGVAAANAADVADARRRGRATGRLELTESMRLGMIAGLEAWRDAPAARHQVVETVEHPGWRVEAVRSPLGVVGFVFEGRPNVFADATGVLRTGNTVVFRIGSDALGTARAIMSACVAPALVAAGLPIGVVQLVDAPSHAAGWALFADARLGLAVARGSGSAVAQLGAVARQHGVPASLHGTGGAWLVASGSADPAELATVVEHSLDRKVCNTLNVCCVVREEAATLVPAVLAGLERAASRRGVVGRLHALDDAVGFVGDRWAAIAEPMAAADLATEWEWDEVPELSLAVVESVRDAVDLFNRHSPRFVASLVSADPVEHESFYASVDAPFVGNGFTRWVDGQFALDRPELGLSNWQSGRLFARGGVLSGDSVFTVRLRAEVRDVDLHR